MPTVRLSFTPAPAHVRTARLVAVAVARRAGVAAELFDEIRLAIGEACSRAVALHREHGIAALVEVALGDDDRFSVRVIDRAPIDGSLNRALGDPAGLPDPVALIEQPAAHTNGDPATEEAVTVGMRLALLAGLVDDLLVRPVGDGPGTEVCMTWPTTQGRGAGRNGASGRADRQGRQHSG